jgi:hypothetical protein
MGILRILRHPWRWADNKLWLHYAPDCTLLIQQIADLGGGTIPAGRWKVTSGISLPSGEVLRGESPGYAVIDSHP